MAKRTSVATAPRDTMREEVSSAVPALKGRSKEATPVLPRAAARKEFMSLKLESRAYANFALLRQDVLDWGLMNARGEPDGACPRCNEPRAGEECACGYQFPEPSRGLTVSLVMDAGIAELMRRMRVNKGRR